MLYDKWFWIVAIVNVVIGATGLYVIGKIIKALVG